MISVRDGQNQILAQLTQPTPPELLAVTRARERVLAEDLRAPFDVPPTDNSAVDGYAVASGDVPLTGARELDVVAELHAGSLFDGALNPGQAVRIMTGAPMPQGADTVYPQEIVERRGSRVSVGPIKKGVNVRLRGEDVQAGTIAIERGTVLRAQELGLITSLGQWQVVGHPPPPVALLSAGGEVLQPRTPRQARPIYHANPLPPPGTIKPCGGAGH